MITFAREGSFIQCLVDTKLNNIERRVLVFNYNAEKEISAEIIKRHLQKTLNSILKDIRQQSY